MHNISMRDGVESSVQDDILVVESKGSRRHCRARNISVVFIRMLDFVQHLILVIFIIIRTLDSLNHISW